MERGRERKREREGEGGREGEGEGEGEGEYTNSHVTNSTCTGPTNLRRLLHRSLQPWRHSEGAEKKDDGDSTCIILNTNKQTPVIV